MQPTLNIKRTVRGLRGLIRISQLSFVDHRVAGGVWGTISGEAFTHVQGKLRELGGFVAEEVQMEPWNWVYHVCGSAGGVRQGGFDENLILRDDRGCI